MRIANVAHQQIRVQSCHFLSCDSNTWIRTLNRRIISLAFFYCAMLMQLINKYVSTPAIFSLPVPDTGFKPLILLYHCITVASHQILVFFSLHFLSPGAELKPSMFGL